MTYIISTLTPIIILVALGAALRRFKFAGEALFREMNRLVYWVGLPVLLFHKTAAASADLGLAFKMFLVLTIATFAALFLAYLIGKLMRLPGGSMGAFLQGSFRGNLAYVGLPVILFALNGLGAATTAKGAEGLAVLAIAPLIPIYNVIAVIVLMRKSPAAAGRAPAGLLKGIGTNPLIIACAAGLAVMLAGVQLPPVAQRSLQAVGQMALPLSLLGVGATLNLKILHGHFGRISAASLIKVAASPLVGYLVGTQFGLPPVELRTVMIFLACPTAVASYVMAQQMGADEHLSGGIVVLSTILAMPALAVVLHVT